MAYSSSKAPSKIPMIIFIMVAVVLVVGLLVANLIVDAKFAYDYENGSYIFDTIDDLNFLNDYVVDMEVEDVNVGELRYTASKVACIEYKGQYFNLFAYEFESAEDALTYASTVAGTDVKQALEAANAQSGHFNSSMTSLLGSRITKITMINQNKVLHVLISGLGKKLEYEFITWLMSNLPTQV